LTTVEAFKTSFVPACGVVGQTHRTPAIYIMFKTIGGATGSEDETGAYLRPGEPPRASSSSSRTSWTPHASKFLLASANIGTSFRTKVTPRNFTFRSREFDQPSSSFLPPSESKDGLPVLA